MPKDHYVARTYLKHFAGPKKMLRAYRKSGGKDFPCKPADICRELDGDVIPDFLSDTTYLGDFRSTFEPLWDSSLASLEQCSINMHGKRRIAGYWASLLASTPTSRRVGAELSNKYDTEYLRARDQLCREQGIIDLNLHTVVEAIDQEKLKVIAEANFVRADNATRLLSLAWALYNSDWYVFQADDGVDFVTSDNPASCSDPGDAWPPMGVTAPLFQCLPMTPRMCVVCNLGQNASIFRSINPDFERKPEGIVRGGKVNIETVGCINIIVAKCAEEIILTGGESEYVRQLAATYATFRVETEFKSYRTERGIALCHRTRVRERTD